MKTFLYKLYLYIAISICISMFVVLVAPFLVILIVFKYLLKVAMIPVEMLVYLFFNFDQVKLFRKEVTKEINKILAEL